MRSSTEEVQTPEEGTVLDNTVCLPDEFDFFLCSHACSVGTAKPAHYIVLHDENRFTADAIHELTSKFNLWLRAIHPLLINCDTGAVRPSGCSSCTTLRVQENIGPSISVGPLRVQENIAGTMFFC